MASKYGSNGYVNVAADTALAVIGGTTVKARIFYICLSAAAAVADAIIDFSIKHFTADGTGTAVTPEPLDEDDRVALATSKRTYTVEPTYAGAPVLDHGINQRSVYQWYAQEGGEIITGKTASHGWGLIIDAFSAGTPMMMASMHWIE